MKDGYKLVAFVGVVEAIFSQFEPFWLSLEKAL